MSKGRQINEVRSRKGSVIAAACAALVVCGGLAVFANGRTTIDTERSSAMAAEDEGTSAETENNTEEKAAAENDEPADSADTLLAKGIVIDPNAVTEPNKELRQTLPEITEGENGKPAPFADYLASADEIVTGMVDKAVPVTVTLFDGTTRNCVKYTIGSFIGTCNYTCAQNRLRFEDMREETILQVVPEGTEPQLKEGEYALFIAQKTRLPDYKEVYAVVGDGAFVYNDHRFVNAYRSDAQLNSDLNSYVSENILYRRNSALVYAWYNALGESVSENYDSEDETIPSYAVTGIEWNEELKEQELTVNLTPAQNRVKSLTYDNDNGGAICNIENILREEKLSGFEDIDFYFEGVSYYPESTALDLSVVAIPREGSGFRFDDTKLSKLIMDKKSIEDIDSGVNSDAFAVTDGIYFEENGELHFSLIFDQAGTDGAMDFDPNRTYTLMINGIEICDSGEKYEGKYEISFRFNDAAIKDLAKARVISADNPAVNGDGTPSE
ncbi:MAG: hypothetical protein K6B74_00710 [Ruminococcus sp.]|nr:hypothetical protein [Ruminococcus sp.]